MRKFRDRRLRPRARGPAWRVPRHGATAGRSESSRRAVADLRRQPCEPALLVAGPDRQGQLQGSADRVAPAHGFSRPAPRHAVFRNPALRERHFVHDGGHAPRGGRARSRNGRNEVAVPRGRRRARQRGCSPRSRSRRGVVVEPGRRRPTHHLRDARLPHDRARRKDGYSCRLVRRRRRRGPEGKLRPGGRPGRRQHRAQRHAARGRAT